MRGRFGEEKVEQLKAAVTNSFAKDAFSFKIRQLMEQILFLENQVAELEIEISALLEQADSFITNIPGIGYYPQRNR